MTDEIRRIDIGFQGGQVLPARVKHKDYDGLRTALGNERADRWFELDTTYQVMRFLNWIADRWFELDTVDSKISVDLAQVVYVRIDTEAQHVGF